MSEFIYVLENSSMPGLVKIGRTERSVPERVNELSSHTGVPTGFTVAKEYAVENSVEVEGIIHERLSDYRVSDNREFFKIETEDAIDIIESILPKRETRRDYEHEDEMVAKAIPIVVRAGMARPRMLEEMLGISYEEALFVIHTLQLRGAIDDRNVSTWKINDIPPSNSPTPKRPKPLTVADLPLAGNYQLPPMDFLQHTDATTKPTETKEELLANSRLMQQILAQFEIEVSLGDITRGPTITRYELHPAPEVKLEQIAELSDNLAAALRAEQINLLLPIPGKGCVGVEVPNRIKSKVIIRDLFESNEWRDSRARIPIALGKDLCSYPIIADLAEMPHCLIAGSTGSGKSTCINSIIVSLLYRFSPDQLRFVMIDPTCLELQIYSGLPHLILPVVTDTPKALLALRWVVNEMEMRYKIFMRVGVRNIQSYNSRPEDKPLFRRETDSLRGEDIIFPQKLSYIVVVIEKFEDVMQEAQTDIESAIARITQMARPSGIHLILTTRQLSKSKLPESTLAEMPARCAFRCASKIESRSIVGAAGAEKLLGKGDMLFLPPYSPTLCRVQSALITDMEVENIVNFIAKQGRPSYELEIHRQFSKSSANTDIESGIDEDENFIQECIDVIHSEKKASVSVLQRRLRLGYTRATRMLDELEARGVVGPSKGAEPRDILIDVDDCEPFVDQPSVIQPHLVVCLCQHCSEKIEFDANELGDRQSVPVPCPHCGIETILSNLSLSLTTKVPFT